MKKTILTIILLFAITALFGQVKAENASITFEKKDTLILPHSKAMQLQAILGYAFQWLPTSDGKAKEVTEVNKSIQDIYPILWPAPKSRDTTAKKLPGKGRER